MNDTADSVLVTGMGGVSEAPAARRPLHRGRLFRKYLLLILTLVTIALLASGAISVYFTYQETEASLANLQHEKALAAASRIEQYIHQIEQQLGYAALPQLDASDVELRRIEFLKLLRQAPEITDIAQLDATGREQIAVSRLGMDSIKSGKDRSLEPAFREATRGRTWFGPVYFRKETEPYMTMAIRSGGEKGTVTVADVNLKFIWDVVSRIKIGDKGKAYVVDGGGFLVADPDIGLVLRKTNLSTLAHVRAANDVRDADNLAMVSTNLAGTQVLTSMAPIESLKWSVFVEQPVAEVYAKLNASILRTVLLLLSGFVISALGALALARGMVRPIRTLDEGAQRIGAGDLDQRIDIRTGDELEALADQFNRMTGQLRESYAGLERKVEAAHARALKRARPADRNQRNPACHIEQSGRRAADVECRRRARAKTVRRGAGNNRSGRGKCASTGSRFRQHSHSGRRGGDAADARVRCGTRHHRPSSVPDRRPRHGTHGGVSHRPRIAATNRPSHGPCGTADA